MEVVGTLFVLALYRATETLWEKAVEDAVWTPAYEAVKTRFLRLAGRDRESQRRAAFVRAAEVARANTLRYAADPQQAERILDVLNGERDSRGAEALAEEAAKLMLFSAVPDVPRLTHLCERTLRFEALFADEPPLPAGTVAEVLADFLTNLREALLDQEPYSDLIRREMLRALRQVVAELRHVAYDDEATYRAQMAAMYRELEFVGFPELKERQPITVEDIFVRLRAEREADLVEMVEEFHVLQGRVEHGDLTRHGRSGVLVKKQMNAIDALRESPRMVVLGDPGAGKTTLLRYLTVICAEGRGEAELGLKADGTGSPLPILIPLREFAAECAGRDQDYSLLDYLYTHAREHLMLNLPRGFFEEALEAGRCLVCLDGLDEVWAVGQRKAVRNAVRALATRFPRSRYVVTSRVVGYEEAPLDRRDFVHHTILPLENEDIREFVRRWYAARKRDPVERQRRTEDLIATIEREPRIQSLACNPLLLTIIALVHRIEAELPHERVKLYDKCVTALVDTWEEVKGLTIEEKQRPFYRYRRRLLERLAYELHTRAEEPGQVQTVKEGDLELLLTRFLMENRRLGFADDPDGAREEARAFIRLARGRTGLLIERGEDVFGFPHLTFQEYLAACDIENRCIHRGVDAIWEEIKDRLHDPHWPEVILLLLGSLNKYDEPPTLLVERILEAGKDDRFEPVLHRHLYLAARALADQVNVADALHRQIVDNLLELAGDAPWWAREDTFTALSWLEEDRYAAESLLALAHDGQVGDEVRRGAAEALSQLGHTEEAVDILLALAHDEQATAEVHCAAAETLGQLGYAEEARTILLVLTHKARTDRTRRAAVEALAKLGPTEKKVLDALSALAHDKQTSARVRWATAEALGQLGCAEEARAILLALARDPEIISRVRFLEASWRRGLITSDEWVVCFLEATIEQRNAIRALARLAPDHEVPSILLTLAQSPLEDVTVRQAAAGVLEELGHIDIAAEVLLALAREEYLRMRQYSQGAHDSGELGDTEGSVIDGLLVLASDERLNCWLRYDAIRILGQLDHGQLTILDNLLGLVLDPGKHSFVRYAAAWALTDIGRAEEKVVNGLLALACDEQVDAWVRRAAAWALGQLGRAEEAVDILLALARDAEVDAEMHKAAYESLKRLAGSPVD